MLIIIIFYRPEQTHLDPNRLFRRKSQIRSYANCPRTLYRLDIDASILSMRLKIIRKMLRLSLFRFIAEVTYVNGILI